MAVLPWMIGEGIGFEKFSVLRLRTRPGGNALGLGGNALGLGGDALGLGGMRQGWMRALR